MNNISSVNYFRINFGSEYRIEFPTRLLNEEENNSKYHNTYFCYDISSKINENPKTFKMLAVGYMRKRSRIFWFPLIYEIGVTALFT
jgi:hypothetical protein